MNRLRMRSIFGVTMTILIGLGVGLSPASAQSTRAVVNPVTLTAGSEFTVQVSGFGDREELVTWVESARGTVYPTRGGVTDRNGNATITISTRTFWEAGWWLVVVRSWKGEHQAGANFELLAAPPSDTLEVSPSTVSTGGRVSFYGYGFLPGDTVSIWATRPDLTTVALPQLVVDESQQIAFDFEVPAGALPGEWAMTAYGRRSNRLLVGSFTVQR